MILSILIPTYNYQCYNLVEILWQQAENIEGLDYEIIVADDGSRDNESIKSNFRINDLSHCRFIRRKENVGRAFIINYLVEESVGKWILIMDSDALVPDDSFIRKYISYFTDDNKVIVGGLYHDERFRTPDNSLRWKYEKNADKHRSAVERNKNPYSKFCTFNIAILRNVFLQIRFDSDCKEYGYEDTLFGIELKRKEIPVLHIDNPLIHVGLESNDSYLKKVEISLRMLRKLENKLDGETSLILAYNKLKKYHLLRLYLIFYKLSKALMLRNILGSNPSLKILSLYKLGYYIDLNKKNV